MVNTSKVEGQGKVQKRGEQTFVADASHSCRNVGSRHSGSYETGAFAAPPEVRLALS